MGFIRFPPSVVPVGEPEQAARERLSDNPVIGVRAAAGQPSGGRLRVRGARRRDADERTGSARARLVGAGREPQGSRGSRRDPPSPSRTDPGAPARTGPLHRGPPGRKRRGGSRRRRSLQRDGAESSGGETHLGQGPDRPNGGMHAALGLVRARSRIFERSGVAVSHSLRLRAEGAETPRQSTASRAQPVKRRRGADPCPQRPRSANEPHGWQRTRESRARRAGRKPSGR